jgi:hypothetical protein
MRRSKLSVKSIIAPGVVAGAAFMPMAARGQIFVVNSGNGTIGEYKLDGTTVATALVSGLSNPIAIAVSGPNLFVTNAGNGTVGEYTTSGGTVNASLITGLSNPVAIAVSGSNLFVNNGSSTVGEYTTSGGTVNASLITGVQSNTLGLAVSGSNLFVGTGYSTIGEYTISAGTVTGSNTSFITGLTDPGGFSVSGTNLVVVNEVSDANNHGLYPIGEYSTLTGQPVNSSLVTGANSPTGTVVSGTNLLVVDLDDGTVDEYPTSGGTTSTTFITGLDFPEGIAVPEPSSCGLLAAGAVGLLTHRRRRNKIRAK